MINCELTWCRNNSECYEIKPNSDEGVCRAESILIRDKGWGPQCRSFDELKECFGKVQLTDKVCLTCIDQAKCVDYRMRKLTNQSLTQKEKENQK